MHPFDVRQMLLEKHAQHVVLIHFPIALFISGVALDFVAQWTKSADAREFAAYINLLLAAVMALPAVATGLVAWQWALEGQRVQGNSALAYGVWVGFGGGDLVRLVDSLSRAA